MDILMHILYLYVMIPSHPARNSASVLNIHPLYWSYWWHILQHRSLLPFSFRSLVPSLYLIIFGLNCDNCFYTFSRGQELTSRQEPGIQGRIRTSIKICSECHHTQLCSHPDSVEPGRLPESAYPAISGHGPHHGLRGRWWLIWLRSS